VSGWGGADDGGGLVKLVLRTALAVKNYISLVTEQAPVIFKNKILASNLCLQFGTSKNQHKNTFVMVGKIEAKQSFKSP